MRFLADTPLPAVAAIMLSNAFFIAALSSGGVIALTEGVLAAAFAILACDLVT